MMNSAITQRKGRKVGQASCLSASLDTVAGEARRLSYSVAKRLEAYTLVELLAVVFIIALVTAIALPGLKALQATAMQTAVRQVTSEMKLSRQYAITRHTPVRFVLAVSTNDLPDQGSNHVCQAYSICELVKPDYSDSSTWYWKPVQDWKFLPDGVVFSDHNSYDYNTLTLPAGPITKTNRTLSGDGSPSAQVRFNTNGLMTVTNMAGGTVQWSASAVEFKPTGQVNSILNGFAGGVRLMQGTVLVPATRELVINDTNNWAYIEYDAYGGRVRTRWRDSYQ